MSDRLTPKWTKTLDEAFGETGTKGRLGEEFLLKVFEQWGWDTRHYENDRQAQIEGRDIEFRKPEWANFYSCDVKNNMDNYGNFWVHKDWLYKIKADRIFHVNPNTGWLVWYGVKEMREIYDQSKEWMKFTAKTRAPFMKVTKANGVVNV